MPSPYNPVATSEQHHKPQHWPRIIHILRCHRQCRWKRQKDSKICSEQNGQHIHGETPFAQRKGALGDLLWCGEALQHEEDERDEVGDVKAQCAEREDSIECRGGADLDEGESEDARGDEEESPERDLVGWVDARKEVGEGEAVVARECPGQAGYGGETVEEGDPAGEHAHRHEHVRGCFGAGGLVGDCDDRVARGAENGLSVVAHAVENGDKIGEGQGSVDQSAIDHRARDDNLGVFDFFGHVDYTVDAC